MIIKKILMCFLAISLSACSLTIPSMRKSELRLDRHEEFERIGNYKSLAKYWDEHAEKIMIDWKSATYLQIWEDQGIAEITIGNGPYYGMIELINTPNGTRVISYTKGGMQKKIDEWMQIIKNAP